MIAISSLVFTHEHDNPGLRRDQESPPRLKREDKTFGDLLARPARDVEQVNSDVWSDETADAAWDRLKESRESFEQQR